MTSGTPMTPAAASESGESSASPPSEPMSLAEACFSIFFAPSKVFAARQDKGWFAPLLIVTLVIVLLFFGTKSLLQPVFDAEIARGIAKAQQANPQMNADQLAAGRSVAEKLTVVFLVIGIPIAIIMIGLVLWLVGRFVGSKQTVKAALTVAAFAYFPKALSSVVGAVIGLFRDPAQLNGKYRITLGPGLFLDPDKTNPAILELVGRLDLFTLWVTVLLAIGLHVTGKVPKAQAYSAAAVVWLIGGLPGLLGALR